MSRSSIARALDASGVISGTLGTVVSLIGSLGVIVATFTACPESVGAARCRAAGHNSARLAVYGLTAAGAAGLLMAAGRVVDPEA